MLCVSFACQPVPSPTAAPPRLQRLPGALARRLGLRPRSVRGALLGVLAPAFYLAGASYFLAPQVGGLPRILAAATQQACSAVCNKQSGYEKPGCQWLA